MIRARAKSLGRLCVFSTGPTWVSEVAALSVQSRNRKANPGSRNPGLIAAAVYEERIAPRLDALGRALEAAASRISAASCYQKGGDLSRAANLYQAALAAPLRWPVFSSPFAGQMSIHFFAATFSRLFWFLP
jgi:hypothetical protein